MLCSINDYFIADGTLAGGYGIKDLRMQITRIFDVVSPIQTAIRNSLDHDPFVPLRSGLAYKILIYVPGDDFTSAGGTNETGAIFIATGPVDPTDWENGSVLQPFSPVLLDRGKRRVEISFNVQRVQDTITDADIYILDHDSNIPRTGDVKLLVSGSDSLTALIVNGNLISNELVKQNGKQTEHAYHITGSLLFAPTPATDHLVTEDGDRITTEGGDTLVVE